VPAGSRRPGVVLGAQYEERRAAGKRRRRAAQILAGSDLQERAPVARRTPQGGQAGLPDGAAALVARPAGVQRAVARSAGSVAAARRRWRGARPAERLEQRVGIEVGDAGLTDLLAAAAAQAQIEQGAGTGRQPAPAAGRLGVVDQRLGQTQGELVVDRTDGVALAAVHAVQRPREKRTEFA